MQANASERLNRSILAEIRLYLKEEYRNWDVHIPEIQHSLCISVYQAIPCYALFGTQMITHGNMYPLLRKLRALNDSDLNQVTREGRLSVLCANIQEHLKRAFERNSKKINLRSSEKVFHQTSLP